MEEVTLKKAHETELTEKDVVLECSLFNQTLWKFFRLHAILIVHLVIAIKSTHFRFFSITNGTLSEFQWILLSRLQFSSLIFVMCCSWRKWQANFDHEWLSSSSVWAHSTSMLFAHVFGARNWKTSASKLKARGLFHCRDAIRCLRWDCFLLRWTFHFSLHKTDVLRIWAAAPNK